MKTSSSFRNSAGILATDAILGFGDFFLFASRVFSSISYGKEYRFSLTALTIRECFRLGVLSLPLITVTGLATGMVLVYQIAYQFQKFGASSYIGGVVSVALARELAPVLSAIVVSGRVGSSLAAELGSMKISEQLDALSTLGIDPFYFLMLPRVLALCIALPLLTVFTDLVGFMGGLFVARFQLGISHYSFFDSIMQHLLLSDFLSGLFKSVFFGLIIALFSGWRGFKAEGGALGLGAETTKAVVYSIITILISDYLLTILWQKTFNLWSGS
ncbi:MAG: ABC transporter permease [Candidatus Wallbacteria bacterium]|nr:ABC transporter permease [Candidatus Wallbacteria bacterium]